MTSLLCVIYYLFVYQLLVLLYLLVTRVKYTEFVGSVCVLHFVFFLVCFVRGWVSRWFYTVFSVVSVIQILGFKKKVSECILTKITLSLILNWQVVESFYAMTFYKVSCINHFLSDCTLWWIQKITISNYMQNNALGRRLMFVWKRMYCGQKISSSFWPPNKRASYVATAVAT